MSIASPGFKYVIAEIILFTTWIAALGCNLNASSTVTKFSNGDSYTGHNTIFYYLHIHTLKNRLDNVPQ